MPSREGKEVQQDPPKEDRLPPLSRRAEYRYIKEKLERGELPSLEILREYVHKYSGRVPEILQDQFDEVVDKRLGRN